MSGTNTWQAEVGQSIVMICLVQSGRGIQMEIEGDIVFLGNLKQPEGETWNKMQHIWHKVTQYLIADEFLQQGE